MKVRRQLAVFLENKPGALATLCEELARSNISLLALTVADTVDHAVVRLVVDKPQEALHVIGGAGVLVVESDVLVARLLNRVGALADVSRRLANAHVNIEYAYCTCAEDDETATLVIRTGDMDKARQAVPEL